MKLLLINPPATFVREMGHRPHDLLIADRQVSHLAAQMQYPHCQFEELVGNKKFSIDAIRQLRRMIRRFQPDLIHAFLPASLTQALTGCLGMRKRPRIVSFRGITRLPSVFDPGDWVSYLSRRVSIHACESNAVKQAMVQGGIDAQKCAVVYNCVEVSKTNSSAAELRRQFDIPQDAFVIGTVACIRRVKGIDILLKAAAECAALPNIYFVIVGEIKDERVRQLAQDERLQNRLKLTGYLRDAQRLMKAFDLFVMPSRREGLCRALLEAMEQSVCPIVSDAGGMKEIVRHGRDGIVFPSENVAALRQSITELYQQPTQIAAYGSSANARVREICSPVQFANRLEAIYENLCGAGSESAEPSD